jgi:rhodanese-related sulfurtransferase
MLVMTGSNAEDRCMSTGTPVREISCSDLKAKRDGGATHVLLDCREADEHAFVRIEGAMLVPMSEIVGRVGELAGHQADEIVVYCHHGMRSLRVATWLAAQGFTNVSSLRGGIEAWAVEVDPSLARY